MGEKKPTWERRMDECKQKHRPKLKNWSRDGFAFQRNAEFKALQKVHQGARGVERIDVRISSLKDFRDRFEVPGLPCIIDNVPTAENWTATTNWTFSKLREDYKDRMLKCGEDDDGYKIKAKMKYFLDYMRHNKDDSPLYIFDGSFDNDNTSKKILDDYKKPSYFMDDLFSLVGEDRRPPYRWFLIGPERSGTTCHLDPLGTSAWNTVIAGRKRWVLFPPDTPRSVAKGLDVILKGEDDESINYFVDMLPRIRDKHGDSIKIYELIQYPGETIFVPGGWWHAVINLDDTIAITQNFCSYVNFDPVWRATRKGRKKMSLKWLRKLREKHPVLADRAEELNQVDNFVPAPSKSSKKKSKKDDKDKVTEKKDSEKKKESDRENEKEEEKKSAERKSPISVAVETGGNSAAQLETLSKASKKEKKKRKQSEADSETTRDSSSDTSSLVKNKVARVR